MNREQLIGKFVRLQAELICAQSRELDSNHMARLRKDIADARKAIECDGGADNAREAESFSPLDRAARRGDSAFTPLI